MSYQSGLDRKNNWKRNGGYTLVEVVVVTVIVSIVFTAIYALYGTTIKYDAESRYEMIAYNLAQEGVEMVHNLRDTNVLSGGPSNWLTGITDGGRLGSNLAPIVNAGNVSLNIIPNPFDSNSYIWEIPSASNLWAYTNCYPDATCTGAGFNYTKTRFKRWVTLSYSDAGTANERLQVTCTVSWASFVNSGITREIKATAILTPWDQN